MTTPNDPNGPGPSENDVEARFAELVSSMPDVASIDPATLGHDLEAVEVVIPHPDRAEESMRLVLEVPPEIAAMVRAEFSPERVAAMMQAVEALAALASPLEP